jgi:hypothetical protein
MKVAIHQPHYLPWLGYLAKWAEADVFVFLDTVQFTKNGWQNRNRIRTADGSQWLTVPVRAHLGDAIADVALDTGQPWARRHLAAIRHAYAGAPYLGRHAGSLTAIYERSWTALAPLAIETATWLARAAGITTPAVLASDLGVSASDPTERLVALCRAVGGTTYLSGRDGVRYLDPRPFDDAGIAVWTQQYEHPRYAQVHGGFVPSLSALDLLLVSGDEALDTLRAGDAWVPFDAALSGAPSVRPGRAGALSST